MPKYHPFTADNQDYVAYICLMISVGFTTSEDLLTDVDGGRLTSFADFIGRVQAEHQRLPSAALADLHRDIYARAAGRRPDPVQGVSPPRVPGDGEPDGPLAG